MSLPSLGNVGGLASAAATNASAAASGLVASAAAAAGSLQPIVFKRIGECSPKEDELRGKKTVHLFDQSRTGDVRALESELTAFVKQVAAFENSSASDGTTTSSVKSYYVGLCSGEHSKLKKALTKRYEHFKPNTGFSHLYAIYSSPNFYHAAEMERRLIFNLSTDSHCINTRNAAIKMEKPDSNENTVYSVFVALRRWGEAMPHQIEGGAVEDDESCTIM